MSAAAVIVPTSPVPIDTEVLITVTFTNDEGVSTSPTTTALSILDPGGNLETYSGGNLTNPGPGQYGYGLTVNQSGVWVGNWQGTGNVVATSGDFSLIVKESVIFPG